MFVTGPVTEVIVPLDKLTRKIKGYGVVTFLIPEHAVKAFTELDGMIFHGRMLHLLPGKAKDSTELSKCILFTHFEIFSVHGYNSINKIVMGTDIFSFIISRFQIHLSCAFI